MLQPMCETKITSIFHMMAVRSLGFTKSKSALEHQTSRWLHSSSLDDFGAARGLVAFDEVTTS